MVVFTYLGYLFGIIRLGGSLRREGGCHLCYSALVIVDTVVLCRRWYGSTDEEDDYEQIAFHCWDECFVVSTFNILFRLVVGSEMKHMACLVDLLGEWQ